MSGSQAAVRRRVPDTGVRFIDFCLPERCRAANGHIPLLEADWRLYDMLQAQGLFKTSNEGMPTLQGSIVSQDIYAV